MPAKSVSLRFYEELNDFLPQARRKRDYSREIFLSPTVKDLIESEGVPHTEVDLILVNGESVGWGHRLQAGDRVSVYPVFEGLDLAAAQRLRPEPLREPRFVLDVHLGTLARRLRLLGFDCLYRNDFADQRIIELSLQERRIILTRDLGILKHGRVTHGYWLRSDQPEAQLSEVLHRFDLYRLIRPFSRCTLCNGRVEEVPKAEVLEQIPAGTAAAFDRFYRCADCGQIYWEGSHYEDLQRWLQRQLPDTDYNPAR